MDKTGSDKDAPRPRKGMTMTYSRKRIGRQRTATVPWPDGTVRRIVHTQTYDNRPQDRLEGNGKALTSIVRGPDDAVIGKMAYERK